MKTELRFAGSGGQGVILASIILAEACYADGKEVAQTQAYGPEARGSACKAELIVSSEAIAYKKAVRPSFLLALTEKAFEEYTLDLADGAVILTDSSLETRACPRDAVLLRKPLIQSCRRKFGTLLPLNMLSLGAVNQVMQLASRESLAQSVLAHVPKDSAELNLKALALGYEL